MMLRNLVDELVRRKLWPIVVLAALVAVGAPLLFLKPASPDAPLASAPAPQAAQAGELPARAQQLMTTAEKAQAARRLKGRAGDPFRSPSGATAKDPAAASGATAKRAAGATASPKPVPVVVTNSDGSKPAASAPATTTTTPGATTPVPSRSAPIGDGSTTNVAKRGVRVDVRFGRTLPSRLHRSIPRMQTFVAGGRVVAIFVKYSPRRRKAVFAIAPSTLVTGDVDCRRKGDVCRYVDVPAGKHVRLTTLASNGSIVSRRLDVVRVGRTTGSGATAAAVSSAPTDGACLLGRLLRLSVQDGPLASDACKS